MHAVPIRSDCPAALYHSDDLVPETYPGMRLTTTEARQVEEILTPHVGQFLELAETTMNGLLPLLHPIPVDPQERQEWEQARDGLSDKRIFLESERTTYRRVLAAYAAADWTKLLYTFSQPHWSTQTPTALTKSLQPLRNELDTRRKELRLAAARRLGCSCLDNPQAAAEAKESKAIERAKRLGRDDAAVDAYRAELRAEKPNSVVTRRWDLPRETANELTRALASLSNEFKLVSHHVTGALVAVALEHLPEVAERLREIRAAQEAAHNQDQPPRSVPQQNTDA
ncbi:hypothetical protein [Streptomyces buecherae]|uniref:hypothetical protein n=1 Tax=Streptomyces buecherae TaxID=2763006 RepID=UPI00379D21D2